MTLLVCAHKAKEEQRDGDFSAKLQQTAQMGMDINRRQACYNSLLSNVLWRSMTSSLTRDGNTSCINPEHTKIKNRKGNAFPLQGPNCLGIVFG